MGLPEILGGNKKYISIICFTITFFNLCFTITSLFACFKGFLLFGLQTGIPLAASKKGYVGGIYKVGPAYDRFEIELITLINGRKYMPIGSMGMAYLHLP